MRYNMATSEARPSVEVAEDHVHVDVKNRIKTQQPMLPNATSCLISAMEAQSVHDGA